MQASLKDILIVTAATVAMVAWMLFLVFSARGTASSINLVYTALPFIAVAAPGSTAEQ